MKGWKRIFFYLVLNVLVTACTITGIFLLWERTNDSISRATISNLIYYYLSPPEIQANTAFPLEPEPPEPTPTLAYSEHEVLPGESIASIAEKYSVSVNELLAMNELNDSGDIQDIKIIRIPENTRGTVIIDRVIGAGDIETERVLLRHSGEGDISLVGWTLDDGGSNIYTFPAAPELTLYKNGAVDVYTRSGNDSVIEMYWGLYDPVWLPGTTITLKDGEGNIWHSYIVP